MPTYWSESSDAGDERRVAALLVRRHAVAGTAVLSTRVLQEFVNVALRKLALPIGLIRARLDCFGTFEVVPATAKLIAEAGHLHEAHRISFRDALSVHAARRSGCDQLLTEDMSAGTVVCGVRLVNPFA